MQVCLITDEISADFETAVELGVAWGVRQFELRGFYDARVPAFSAYQCEIIGETLARYGAQLVTIAPGVFKVPYPAGDRHRLTVPAIDRGFFEGHRAELAEAQRHLEEVLPAAIEFARGLGVRRIIGFGFNRGGRPPGPPPDGALRLLEQAGQAVAAAGLELAIEVEDGFWLDTGARSAEVLRSLNQPALGINWDPCNALLAGETPFPDGYAAVRGLVRHVHFKDVLYTPQGLDFVVQGQIDWPGQVAALRRDGYTGYIAIETHRRPKVQSAHDALTYVQGLLARDNAGL